MEDFVGICKLSVTKFRSVFNIVELLGTPGEAVAMRQRIRRNLLQSTTQVGSAFLMIGIVAAGVCLCFATALAAVSASPEERIVNLRLFGLIPAVGFYSSAKLLSRALRLSGELCDILAIHCFRHLPRLMKALVNWASLHILGAIKCVELRMRYLRSELGGRHKAHISVTRFWWSFRAAAFDLLYLLVRSAARFLSKIQSFGHLPSQSIATGVTWAKWSANAFGRGRGFRSLTISTMFLGAFALGWFGENAWHPFLDVEQNDAKRELSIDAVVDRIIVIESDGDQKLKNTRSSATGLGQFLDETWLDLIRSYRSDLARGRSDSAILGLWRDGQVAREITVHFTEQNARILKKRGLPVTPGTLYLAHFAGVAGAVAILSALENADAASVMANADVTGRTKREKLVKANPFLETLTVADLRSWADRKMRFPGS